MTDEQIRRRIAAEKRRKRQRRRLIAIVIAAVLAVVDGFLIGRMIGIRSAEKALAGVQSGQTEQYGSEPTGSDAAVTGMNESEQSSLSAAPVSVADTDIPFVQIAVNEVTSDNTGGRKFWSWYGYDSRVSWCACYVSWCEDQAGYLDSGAAPRFANVADGSDWFKSRSQAPDGDSDPQAGDLIFFDWEQDNSRDHVGIVTAVVGDKVFTVEGNSSDRCRLKRYTIGDPVIYGYGRIETEE